MQSEYLGTGYRADQGRKTSPGQTTTDKSRPVQSQADQFKLDQTSKPCLGLRNIWNECNRKCSKMRIIVI